MNSITIELGHITLRGLSFGSVDKPLLLALHGWLDNAASFIPLAAQVEDYHVIAIEWPGHGHSDHREAGANYHITDYVFDLYVLSQYLAKHYDCAQLNIVAHSMGGIVASIFAGTFAERVNKIVMIESFGPLVAKPEDSTNILRKSLEQRGRAIKRTKPLHPTLESAIVARTNAGDFNRELATLLVKRGSIAIDGGYTWRSDSRLRSLSPMRMTEAQAQDFLSGITAPVLLIMGETGIAFAKEQMAKRVTMVEQVETLHLPGGHHVHMEQPTAIAEAISKFIK